MVGNRQYRHIMRPRRTSYWRLWNHGISILLVICDIYKQIIASFQLLYIICPNRFQRIMFFGLVRNIYPSSKYYYYLLQSICIRILDELREFKDQDDTIIGVIIHPSNEISNFYISLVYLFILKQTRRIIGFDLNVSAQETGSSRSCLRFIKYCVYYFNTWHEAPGRAQSTHHTLVHTV